MNDDGHDDGGAMGGDESFPDDSFFDDEESLAGYDDEITTGGDPFGGPEALPNRDDHGPDPFEDEPDETVREEGHVSEADRNGEDPKSADDPVNDGSAGGDRPGFPVDESSPWLTSSPSSGGELLIGLHDAGVTVVRDGAEFSSVWAGERHGLEPVPGYVDPNQLGDSEPVTR